MPYAMKEKHSVDKNILTVKTWSEIKQFPIENGRYIVFLFHTDEFLGEVTSSDEGEMVWVKKSDLSNMEVIKEDKAVNKEWQRLYEEAMSVLDPHDVSNKMWVGSVASAVLTKKGNIYKGICIDTDGSIGMCAERNALSTMLTYGESEITKVVSVYKDGNIIPSCGICREFMMHLGGDVENIEILLDQEGRTARLIDLMPEYPRHK